MVVPAGSYATVTINYNSNALGWYGVAASVDFTTMVATVYNGNIYKSTNSGASWTTLPSAGIRPWLGVTCNAVCSKIAAVANSDNIWLSTDGGDSWSALTGAGVKSWQSITSNSDFTKFMATVYNGKVYRSEDSGLTWILLSGSPTKAWQQIASNGDFTKFLAATTGNSNLYTSINSGVNWDATLAASTADWKGVCVSSNFVHMAATSNLSYPWISHDSGVTWNKLVSAGARQWVNMAATPDFTKVVAPVYGHKIYHTVYDGPINATTWATTGPVTQLALVGGTGIASCPFGTVSIAGSSACSPSFPQPTPAPSSMTSPTIAPTQLRSPTQNPTDIPASPPEGDMLSVVGAGTGMDAQGSAMFLGGMLLMCCCGSFCLWFFCCKKKRKKEEEDLSPFEKWQRFYEDDDNKNNDEEFDAGDVKAAVQDLKIDDDGNFTIADNPLHAAADDEFTLRNSQYIDPLAADEDLIMNPMMHQGSKSTLNPLMSVKRSSKVEKKDKKEKDKKKMSSKLDGDESSSSSAVTPLPPPKSVFGMKKPSLPASLMTDGGYDSQMGAEVVNRKPARIAVAEDSSDSGSGSDGEQSTFSEVNTAKEKEVNTGNSSDEDSNIRVISKSD